MFTYEVWIGSFVNHTWFANRKHMILQILILYSSNLFQLKCAFFLILEWENQLKLKILNLILILAPKCEAKDEGYLYKIWVTWLQRKGSSSFTFLKETTKENMLVGQLKLGLLINHEQNLVPWFMCRTIFSFFLFV